MKAVVTGGAGFIGSHLVDRLLAEGLDVVVLDNLETGRRENCARALKHPRCRLHEVDIARGVPQAVFAGADWVFHLAGLADIVPSMEAPARYHQVNVDGTVHVLEAARTAGVARLVYAASSSCYGIPEAYPTPETAAIQPMYPYALTKHVGEAYVLHWARVYGLPAVSLRLFNVYGPRSRTTGAYGAVFGVFLAQKLAGAPYTVVGDGQQRRDFVFVEDVVEAFLQAARAPEAAVAGQALNIGAGEPQSINRLVELLGGEKVHIPRRPGEPDITHADIALARRLLGWSPRTSFADGVAAMLRHIDLWKDAPVWDATGIARATASWFKHLG